MFSFLLLKCSGHTFIVHVAVAYTHIRRDLSGMGAVKTVLKATIFFLVYVKNRGFAQSSFQNQKYFKKIHDHGKLMENRFITRHFLF